MVDFSNAKIISLAVHKVGNKSKDEELILTDVISTIADNIAEQYIKEYFFSSFNFDLSYLNSDVLPMAINHSNQNKLLLLVKDKFCKEYLRRLIGLAQELTSDWAANIIIAFPNFNSFEDEETVVACKAEFEDSSFTDKVTVITYDPDFRDEV